MKDGALDQIEALERELNSSREREQHYRNLFDSMNEGFGLAEILVDEQGSPCDYRLLEVNEAFGRLTGFPPEVANGKTARELAPGLESYWIEAFGRVALTGEPAQFENYAEGPDKWFKVTAYRTGPKQFAHLFVDITKRKRVEQALRESEQRLRLISDSVPVLIAYVDAEERYQFNNAAYEKWFGLSPAQVKGCSLREVLGGPAYDRIKPWVKRALAGEMVRFDMVLPFRLGGSHEVEAAYVPHIDATGKVLGFYALVQDVSELSEHKRAEARLRASEEKYRTLVENLDEGIWLIDAEGYTTFVNTKMAELLGYEVEEMLGKHLFAFLDPPGIEAAKRNLERGRAGVKAEYDFQFRCKDGSPIWTHIVTAPLHDAAGGYLGALAGVTDISKRKRVEEALHRANGELQHFAYVASHDLRAPLRAVSNLSSWLEEDLGPRLSSEARHKLQLIRERLHVMDDFIEALLAYSRAGGQSVRVEAIDSGRLIEEVIAMNAFAEGFRITIAGSMPHLVTDRTKLQQVFTNLIANAIKYHDRPDGQVQVSVREAGTHYEFSVADDGPGIPAEYRERIFLMFQRGPTRGREGTGIGLAVVKKIVESVGGGIELTSELGKGTTVRFTWPKVIEPESGSES